MTTDEHAERAAGTTAHDRVSDVTLDFVGHSAISASAAIYGTILVLAVIAALSEDPAASPLEIASASLLTVVVFWLAHVYADVVGIRAATPDQSRCETPFAMLVLQRPMVGAALIPALPLLIAAATGVHRIAAIGASLAVGIVELFVWGYVAGRQLDSRAGRVGGALFLALLGVGITLLKRLVH